MRIVIKVGTSTIAHNTGNLNIRLIEKLCKVISDLKNSGHEIIFVSSGAVALGSGKIGVTRDKIGGISAKQALASIGQCELMYIYDKLFSEYNHVVGQILVTSPDIADEYRCKKFENTLYTLLDLHALPIINENDTVSTEEIEIGDNDTLSAIIASKINADILIILSSIDGLYDKNPSEHADAKVIKEVRNITPEICALSYGKNLLGTGGMDAKIHAAQIATESGCDMYIANGNKPELLYDIVDGKSVGTRFIKK